MKKAVQREADGRNRRVSGVRRAQVGTNYRLYNVRSRDRGLRRLGLVGTEVNRAGTDYRGRVNTFLAEPGNRVDTARTRAAHGGGLRYRSAAGQ